MKPSIKVILEIAIGTVLGILASHVLVPYFLALYIVLHRA
jgi:hypothetical protein